MQNAKCRAGWRQLVRASVIFNLAFLILNSPTPLPAQSLWKTDSSKAIIADKKKPWGIVTYPKSVGSLDMP